MRFSGLPFDVSLEFGIKSLHLGSNGLKLGFVLWILEELGGFHDLSLNVMELFLEILSKFLELFLDFWVAVDESIDVLLDFSLILLELLVDLVVHGELPHFGFWVKLEVLLEFVVKSLELGTDSMESSA